MITTPEQIDAVARVRLVIQSAVEDDARAWELTDTELAVIAASAINTMRPFIRAEVLEEAAKVAEGPVKRRSLVTGEVIYRGDDEHDYAVDGSSDYGAGHLAGRNDSKEADPAGVQKSHHRSPRRS